MHILKKVLVGLCATLLAPILLTLGLVWSLHQVVGTPAPIEAALKQSGIYETGVGAALDQAQKDQSNDSTNKDSVPVNKPEVRAIIEQTFPPAFLQTQVEHALGSIYDWLNGKQPKLAFTVDLADSKTRLADGVGTYVDQHLKSLPVCTAANMPSNMNDVDAFNATCVPPGYNIADASAKAKAQILNGDFLKDAKFDADTTKNDQGKTLSEQLKNVPRVYQRAKTTLYLAIVSAIVLAAAVVFLSSKWRSGVKRVAIIAISTGTMSALTGWLAGWGVHRAAIEFAKNQSSTQPLQQKLIHITEILAGDLRTAWMGYGILLIVLGVGALVALHFIKPAAAEQADVLAHKPSPVEKELKPDSKPLKPKLPEIKE
ncbi:MAG TPA: hypothetical protein VLH86_01365 [Patescibacteria group bacterium]|nr:hypothetical protein [Patescibacteria group bacterium]